jgi:hypothetical protein
MAEIGRGRRKMMLMKRKLLGLTAGVLMTIASPSAHHSFGADYLEEQTVSIEGEVVAFEFKFPHAWLHLLVEENGQRQKYSIEWSNPGRLKQAGFTAQSFKPGDRLVVTGSPGRNPSERRMHLRTIRRPSDGWKWPRSGRDDEL